ncbi:ATP-binding protein [Paenibacillus filicis]|uniref:histidine kinase n=1 Tax=Paenibacillus filicis TaxID=669464 RepID=A0ABU9DI25_9BACL
MMRIKQKINLTQVAFLILALSILFVLRLLWYGEFVTSPQPLAVQGVLDLRGWNLEGSRSITLDGEWELYPETFISHEDMRSPNPAVPHFVQVPGDWGRALNEDTGSSFGYGTYRLRIQVDHPLEQPYGFWIQEIQASSVVEINGQRDNPFGKPAAQPENYLPKAISYTASYAAGDQTMIELLVRSANFDQPLMGGITRSIRFGSQAVIDTERMYSIGLQLVTFVILMLHALYAGLLFTFNPRQKTFLTFFMLLLSVSFSVIADHDSLLGLWVPLSYAGLLKIKLLSYMGISFFMLLLSRNFSGDTGRSWIFTAYAASLGLYSAFILASPSAYVYYSTDSGLFTFFYLFPIAWTFSLIIKMVLSRQKDAVFLLFAAASILSSILWGFVSHLVTAASMYYPVDVFAALIGFSGYWFKRYFRNSEENTRLTEQLRKADKLKDQFLANTSHELRTPLHGIMNIAQTVISNEKHALGDKSFRDMELLVTISRRMSHLLGDLLDIVRLQDKRVILKPEPVSVQSTAAGVVDMLRYMTDGIPVSLRLDIPADLPVVFADEKRLIQILFNLVHNAIKYTDEGTITVSAETKGTQVVIHVSDTGHGMDEQTQSRIFLPYEQGPQGVSEGGGIGLGLSISRQLVELHGSLLTVRSRPGHGSVFSFTLPNMASDSLQVSLAEPHRAGTERLAMDITPSIVDNEATTAAAAETGSIRPALHRSEDKGRLNILAVDDDPVNLKVLSSILSAETYRIRTAMSAQEALELLGAESWDLLIADVMMPHMSGYELTRLVRQRFTLSELPVLLLTARSQPEDIYAGFRSGANDYITKPVDAMELQYRVWSLATLKQSIHDTLRMEAAYLQAQIHPHFLFNTLNSIMALSEIDPEKMRRLGDAFTSYLRISIDFLNAEQLVALSHELELVRAYLYIEKERFEERLSIEWEIDPGLDLLLPPLTLQPLVENAVKHGLLSKITGGTLHIRIARQDKSTLFEVRDNGMGMTRELADQLLDPSRKLRGGIGLLNTNRRLTQTYGQGLSIRSKPGHGTTVSFVIPDRNEP